MNYAWMDDVGLELEVGARYTERQEGTTTSEGLEYFFLVGYHYDFDVDERSLDRLKAD